MDDSCAAALVPFVAFAFFLLRSFVLFIRCDHSNQNSNNQNS